MKSTTMLTMMLSAGAIEAGAMALARHKSLRWESISENWREQQRAQARVILAAAQQALQGLVAEEGARP